MQNQDLDALCCRVCGLVSEVGDFIRAEMGKVQPGQVELKALNSLVSYVDKEAELRLVQGLSEMLPGSRFLTEEETSTDSAEADSPWRWIVDPLDGTTNFLHQIPFFSVSVALQYQEETVIGVVLEVTRQELFYAWRNGGAYLNGQPIEVSRVERLSEALLATGFPYHDFGRVEHYLKLLALLFPRTRGLRRLGSAALDLAYVACGRFEAFFEYSLSPWDVAAGAFLVREAGGRVGNFAGQPDELFGGEILAYNHIGLGEELRGLILACFQDNRGLD